MKIENEVSGKFENNYHKAAVNIIYTYGWVNNILRKRLSKYDITVQQFNILRILKAEHPKPATVNLLKERMLDKMSDASRIVERLVQKDLVIRRTNQKDRRAVDIFISEKGLALLRKLDPGELASETVKDNLSLEEAEQLSNLLDKLRG